MLARRWFFVPVTLLALASLACNTLFPGGSGPTNAPPTASDTPSAADTTPSPTTAPSETPAPAATTQAAPTETPAPAATSLLAYLVDGQVEVSDVTGGVLGGTTQLTQVG